MNVKYKFALTAAIISAGCNSNELERSMNYEMPLKNTNAANSVMSILTNNSQRMRNVYITDDKVEEMLSIENGDSDEIDPHKLGENYNEGDEEDWEWYVNYKLFKRIAGLNFASLITLNLTDMMTEGVFSSVNLFEYLNAPQLQELTLEGNKLVNALKSLEKTKFKKLISVDLGHMNSGFCLSRMWVPEENRLVLEFSLGDLPDNTRSNLEQIRGIAEFVFPYENRGDGTFRVVPRDPKLDYYVSTKAAFTKTS